MRKVLVIEIDMTGVEESWTVSVQRARFETHLGIERQVIVKRSSRDALICIPETGEDNFVSSVTLETHDS